MVVNVFTKPKPNKEIFFYSSISTILKGWGHTLIILLISANIFFVDQRLLTPIDPALEQNNNPQLVSNAFFRAHRLCSFRQIAMTRHPNDSNKEVT